MAPSQSPPSIKPLLLYFHFFFLCVFFSQQTHSASAPYSAIFSFGNSLADTGNYLLAGPTKFSYIASLPYGETYFHFPTGRACDGRLIVDFIGCACTSLSNRIIADEAYVNSMATAEAYGVPMLPPYLARSLGASFRQGVNFAVVGATALDPIFFDRRNLSSELVTNSSLSVQLGWFKDLKSSLCYSTKCKFAVEFFRKSLFLVGEIGGNDYNFAFFGGKSVNEIVTYVPEVANAIASAVRKLIEQGAMDLVVPGNFPIGCSAIYLTYFQSSNRSDYDANGCIIALNQFAEYHNSLLQSALEQVRKKYPNRKIIYADYYDAAVQFFISPEKFGFSNGALSACCGGLGPYNYNSSTPCGALGATVCPDPTTYVNWDGIHFTEAAYHVIAAGLANGPYATPPMAPTPHLN
ncbi:hypothetical protein ACLOJK_010480 [Asimina triloba]